MYGHDCYTYSDLNKTVKYVANVLKGRQFDTIVFKGFSGATVGPCVALKTRKAWALVRDKNYHSHSAHAIEGIIGKRYVIVDDFIETGKTINEIIRVVRGRFPESKCIGYVLYANRMPPSYNENKTKIPFLGIDYP